jgi:hypothetical protein
MKPRKYFGGLDRILHFKQLLHIAHERYKPQSYRCYNKFGSIDRVDYVPTYFRFK